MKLAHSIQLTPEEFRRALTAFACAKAKQRGVNVPDPAFADQLCEVHLLGAANVPADVQLVTVTWVSS